MRLGFACSWDDRPELTWSHTPWNLRAALRTRAEVVDVGVTVPPVLRRGLKVAYARRVDGRWTSMWKHAPATRRVLESSLRSGASRNPCDVILQIQDLAEFDTPYLVFQDLSYDVLLDVLDEERTLTHFPGLQREQLLRLRDRQRRIYANASGVLAMSRWFADHLVVRSGVPADRVHVVNPGASAGGGPPAAEVLDRRIAGPRRKLLMVGKDFLTKGGVQVLDAVALLRAQHDPGLTLTVVGPSVWPLDGPPPDGVRFLGRLPIEQLSALYDEHDLFVMPSRFEGFGIALVEALAHGLPCVARDAFAMPEIVRPGENGGLVGTEEPAELAEVIATVLADQEICRRVVATADAVRAHYSWGRAAEETLAVARHLV